MKLALLITILCCAATAGAQTTADEPRFRAGVRAGIATIDNEAYEKVYGTTMPLVSADASVCLTPRWSLRASGELGRTTGELYIPVPDARPAGEVTFETIAAHLTLLRSFTLSPQWSVRGGIGATQLSWTEEAEFGSNSGSGTGGHVTGELTYRRGLWEIGPAVSYWLVPDALPATGVAGADNALDLGGFHVALVAAWHFGRQ